MYSPTPTSFSPTPLQQRRGAPSSIASTLLSMPKPFSEKGLPLPSSARRKSIFPLSQRSKRRVMLAVLALVAIVLFSSFTGSSRSGSVEEPRHAEKAANADTRHGVPGRGYEREVNGLDEEDMLAEDQIAVDNEVEERPKSPAEKEAEAVAEKQQAKDEEDEKKKQLRALIWWLHTGGSFLDGHHKALKDSELKKMTGSEFQTYLTSLKDASQPDPDPFTRDRWEDWAAQDTGVTVFSKVSPTCKTADPRHTARTRSTPRPSSRNTPSSRRRTSLNWIQEVSRR